MSSSQQYIGTPKSPQGRLVTANTNRDGSGTVVDIYTAGASGGRVDDIKIKANGVTTAGMVRLFKHDTVNYRLWMEVPVTAVAAPSATVATFEATLTDLGLVLAAGHKIAAAPHNGEQFEVHVTRGGDF